MVSIASLLGARHLADVMVNKPASSLVLSLKGTQQDPHFYVEDRWSRLLGDSNSQVRVDIPSERQRYDLLCCEWRINMDNNPK